MPPIVVSDIRLLREIPEHGNAPALLLVHISGPMLNGGISATGESFPPPPQPAMIMAQATKAKSLPCVVMNPESP
jgi:hypothetical protein